MGRTLDNGSKKQNNYSIGRNFLFPFLAFQRFFSIND